MKLRQLLTTDACRKLFEKLYGNGEDCYRKQLDRYETLIQNYINYFKEEPQHLFSSPGRTEIGGNHTDHNRGLVLAASINLDTIAAVNKNESGVIRVYSEGYTDVFCISLNDLSKKESEKETTNSIIRGIAAQFRDEGYQIGGFNAYIASDVYVGSGLSSSASFEVMIGTILNTLYNGSKIVLEKVARIGQYAENEYFGKPCGLMDQLATAVGNTIMIDFENPDSPRINQIRFDLAEFDYAMVLINTGGNHIDLNDEYIAVYNEMQSVARQFARDDCRDLTYSEILGRLPDLRKKVGDRAILRAIHFLNDNERVLEEVAALEKGAIERFLDLVNESGNSSFKFLQNCYSIRNPEAQGIPLALAITEMFFKNSTKKSACRVHGGGFAGTILTFIPKEDVSAYVELMTAVFGKDAATVLTIRPVGAIWINRQISKISG
ncbi:MAG TPA: galactokinase [Candidatus Marinimicrobia bacterium]|nr:galactokinase [Candidatus Neomarinimicrobiota bacterium]